MTGFGLDHLPYGVVGGRCVVRYEDQLLALGTVPGLPPVFDGPTLNGFLALGRPAWEQVREQVTRVLEAGTVELEPLREPELGLALGFVTGPGKPLGQPIPAADVREHVFGFVLVNDWSARDLQRFEYRPLG